MTEDLIIIGAGISGLTAALEAQKAGLERVVLLDYKQEIGGFTRLGMESEEYAEERQLLSRARQLPYGVKTKATVVGLFVGEPGNVHQLFVQTPNGTESIQARRILIASGSLEKPREAHKIAGPRPAGVMTPSLALELLDRAYKLGDHLAVYLNGRQSRSVLAKLRRTHSLVSIIDGAAEEIVRVRGASRLESVLVKNRLTGEQREILCDGLVFAKGRYPSTFYLKGTTIDRDDQMAVRIDSEGRTNVPGVFACGSCTTLGDDHHERSIALAEAAAETLLRSL